MHIFYILLKPQGVSFIGVGGGGGGGGGVGGGAYQVIFFPLSLSLNVAKILKTHCLHTYTPFLLQ